jgi:large subunit ribosomal protein L13
MMKTTIAKGKSIIRQWYLIDAQGQILGRMATQIASILMGKHKPRYTPFLDTGDFVIVVNADKIRVTGKKLSSKMYQRFSGYPSGRKEIPMKQLMQRDPAEVVRLAVKRMLPHTTLGRHMFKKLKVYSGPDHPHSAQQPLPIKLS